MPARAFFACFTFSTFAFIMNEELDPNIENLSEEEIVFEQVLRPKQFDDFFGQEKIVDNLKVFIGKITTTITKNSNYLFRPV